MLNSRYLMFHVYEPRYAGVFQTARLNSTGRILSIALSSIMDVAIESGVRARASRPNWKDKDDFEKKSSGKRAINRQPGLLDDPEHYSNLMLTTETENGVEIAAFEVQNPQSWEMSLKTHVVKSTS